MQAEDRLHCELHSRRFGRKGVAAAITVSPRSTLADDLRLFALTFACGFLFVTVFLA